MTRYLALAFAGSILLVALHASAAEIVVLAVDTPVADGPGRGYKGMVMAVGEDGTDWGTEVRVPPEKGGRFAVVKIEGKASDILKAYPDLADAYVTYDGEGNPTLVAKRIWKFQDATLRPEEKAAITKDGAVALTAEAVKAVTVNAKTGKTLATTASAAPK